MVQNYTQIYHYTVGHWTQRSRGKGVADYRNHKRLDAVKAVVHDKRTLLAASAEYGISRKTLAKWVRFYKSSGEKSLRSMCPGRPRAIRSELIQTVLSMLTGNIHFRGPMLTVGSVLDALNQKRGVKISRWTLRKFLYRIGIPRLETIISEFWGDWLQSGLAQFQSLSRQTPLGYQLFFAGITRIKVPVGADDKPEIKSGRSGDERKEHFEPYQLLYAFANGRTVHFLLKKGNREDEAFNTLIAEVSELAEKNGNGKPYIVMRKMNVLNTEWSKEYLRRMANRVHLEVV